MHKIQNIQALRGIAVLFVLMVHIGLVENKYSAHSILPDLVQFGMSGVDIFFVISGFIMMTISMQRKKDMENAFKFLYSRVMRIYPIYWFYSVLILIVFIIHPVWVNSSTSEEIELLKSFLLFPQNTPPLLQVGWTLIHEMYFYIGFFLLLFFLRSNRSLVGLTMVWGILVIILDSMFDLTDPVMKVVLHPLTLEFVGGVIIAYGSVKIDLKISVSILKRLLLLSLFMLLLNYMLFDAVYETDPFRWWRVALFGLPAMLLLYTAVKLEEQEYVLPEWLIATGDRSYTIYLSHLLVINAVGRVWQYFSFDNVVLSFIFILLLIMSTLLYGKYAYKWIEVPMLNYLKSFRKNI